MITYGERGSKRLEIPDTVTPIKEDLTMDNERFIEIVQSEIEEITGLEQDYDKFPVWFLTRILREEEGKGINEYAMGASGDNKIDIGICDEDHQTIIIAQCKYTEDPLNEVYDTSLPEDAKNAKDRIKSVPESGNRKRKEFAKRVKPIIEEKEKTVRLLAVGFGKFSDEARRYGIANDIEIYDFDKIKERYIYNEIRGETREPDAISLNVNPDEVIEEIIGTDGSTYTYRLFYAPIADIANAVKEHKDGFFNQNLRDRLDIALKSTVGDQIIKTITGPKRLLFPIFNNGITISCRGFNPGDEVIELIAPQVINGCQTCWAISDAIDSLRGTDIDFSGVKVAIKLVESSEDEFIRKVTRTTNTQNPISSRDIHSTDTEQETIAYNFQQLDEPIYFDIRRGAWDAICRTNDDIAFRIRSSKYRKISNELAGQIYLALMGKPFWSKQNKKKIFDDPYYTWLFRCEKDEELRFDYPANGVSKGSVTLKSGYENYVKDIIFGFKLYKFADLIRDLYNKKVRLYDADSIEEEGPQKLTYEVLDDQRGFIKNWHYLYIGLVHHIVEKYVDKGESRNEVREKLLTDNYNSFFTTDYKTGFTVNEELGSADVISEDNSPDDYKILSKWTYSLIVMVNDEVDKYINSPSFNFRNFIDQREETFSSIIEILNLKYVKDFIGFKALFPLDVP